MNNPTQFLSDKLIYLDIEFISRKYEENTGLDPSQKTTKSEGALAKISALFANAGVVTNESRTFSITSRKMLKILWDSLINNYEKFDGFKNYTGTQIVWVEGKLTLGEWSDADKKEIGYQFYQLNHKGEKTAFLTEESYFSAGFAKIFEASSALKGNIGIPVLCLTRIMWHVDDAKNYVACPYIIIENS